MYLTIETTHRPATDLGFLLHKNPETPQSMELPFGTVHCFYPVKEVGRCQAAFYLEIDPIALVRGNKAATHSQWALGQYVNDRPYAVSSLMSVAINKVLGQALRGKSKERPELAAMPIPIRAGIGAVTCREGAGLIRDVFEPLGYSVDIEQYPLDEKFPEWGANGAFNVTLAATIQLSTLLTHLYVLIPVLDDDKHYWVTEQEIEKLLVRGKDWLDSHPKRDLITKRYLKHQRGLTRQALARLAEEDDIDPDATVETQAQTEISLELPISLRDRRMEAIAKVLLDTGAKCVLDLGCGEGALLKVLLEHRQFTSITGVDVSMRALHLAERRLDLKRMPPRQRERLTLLHGSLAYGDERFHGFDAAVLAEVIEHLDLPRLAALEINVFKLARPGCVIITTPNYDYNKHFERLPAGSLRHPDHRFEWTRQEFTEWCRKIAGEYGYDVAFSSIGDEVAGDGAPTQMGVFTR